MKTTKFLTTMMAIAIALLLNSCTKTGPTGPAGPTGPQGPAGQNGTNGTSGLTVTNIAVSSGSWIASSTTEWYYNTSISVPTTDVCLVYFSENATGYSQLPFSSYFYNGDELFFAYETGDLVTLYYYNPGGEALTSTLYFNIIEIPPASIYLHPNTNWKNYSQVQAILDAQNAVKN